MVTRLFHEAADDKGHADDESNTTRASQEGVRRTGQSPNEYARDILSRDAKKYDQAEGRGVQRGKVAVRMTRDDISPDTSESEYESKGGEDEAQGSPLPSIVIEGGGSSPERGSCARTAGYAPPKHSD